MVVPISKRGVSELMCIRCLVSGSKPHTNAGYYFHYDCITVVGIWGSKQRNKGELVPQPTLSTCSQHSSEAATVNIVVCFLLGIFNVEMNLCVQLDSLLLLT